MKLSLSKLRPEHIDAIHSWRGEAASQRHNPLIPLTLEETRKFLSEEGSSFANLRLHAKHRWVWILRGKPVGTVSLQNISHMMGSAEIGYMVGEEFQGQGIATAGLRIFLRELFARTEIRRVIALVHEENTASCRVLEKLGFQQEGLLREHFIIQGQPVNEIYFALLRKDWEALNAP